LKKKLEIIWKGLYNSYLCTPNHKKGNDSVAQLVEQYTFNVWVLGSSPSGITGKQKRRSMRTPFLFSDSLIHQALKYIMRSKDPIITALSGFRNRDKFSHQAFQKRGLNRSDAELCDKLESILNECTDQLITAINDDINDKGIAKILKNNLNNLNRSDFDTEERELICDYFHELSQIVVVKISADLNGLLYGRLFSIMMKISNFLRGPEKVVETQEQPCTNCNIPLRTSILKRQEDAPDYGWTIIRCNSCSEYNLLSIRGGVGECRFENYHYVERLPTTEYSEEQAKIRLEQIKFFRRK
jgi:hypothetical protein